MTTQHTPGPWSMDQTHHTYETALVSATGAVVAFAAWDGGSGCHLEIKNDADANLIVASPDLFEAAVRLVVVFDQQRMTAAERIIVGVSDAGLRTEGNAAIEALRAAIAKATVA